MKKRKKNNFKGFYETLCETIEDEEGIYKDILKYCPSFFRLLCNILSDKRTDWHTKLVIDAALSYFVVPEDIIPEDEYGAEGYIDDVFVCAYVLKEIKNKVSEELLVDNWKEEGDILEIVEIVFSESKKVIGDKYTEILQFIGLRKGKLPTIRVEGTGNKIQRLLYERRELIGLLAYLTRMIYNLPPGTRRYKPLKEYLKSQDKRNEIEEILKLMDEKGWYVRW